MSSKYVRKIKGRRNDLYLPSTPVCTDNFLKDMSSMIYIYFNKASFKATMLAFFNSHTVRS